MVNNRSDLAPEVKEALTWVLENTEKASKIGAEVLVEYRNATIKHNQETYGATSTDPS